MKPIILKSHEVIHLRDTGSVIAWRVVKPQPEFCGGEGEERDHSKWGDHCMDRSPTFVPVKDWPCPYGRTGEERWVKETFRFDGIDHLIGIAKQDRSEVVHKADLIGDRMIDDCPWTPSTHMPQWASRFTVTLNVGLKRIQEVTEEEAMDSGVEPTKPLYGDCGGFKHFGHIDGLVNAMKRSNPGSWDRNDYFWSIKCTLTK